MHARSVNHKSNYSTNYPIHGQCFTVTRVSLKYTVNVVLPLTITSLNYTINVVLPLPNHPIVLLKYTVSVVLLLPDTP